MKRKLMFISVILCLINIETSAEKLLRYSQNSRGEDVVDFSITDYSIQETIINGELCSKVVIDNLPNSNEKGAPALPYKTMSIALEYDGDYKVEIDMLMAVEKSVGRIVPAKGKIYRKVNPESISYSFNNDIYNDNNFYPAKVVTIDDTYLIREQRGATIKINPIQYNPVTGTIKIVKKLQFRVIPIERITRKASFEEESDIYNKLLSNHFVNYSKSSRYTAVDEGDKMIIITASKYKSAAEKLAFWKNRSGIKTDIYEYPADFNGEGDQAVKALIQEKYDSDKISYILIIGDYADVPSPSYTQQEYSLTTGADPTYTYLSGNDKKPDAFIGRFSVETEEQAMTVVNKNLNYECNPTEMGTNDTEWFTSCMGIASNEGSPTDKEWLNGFKDTLFNYNYKTYDSAYDPGASASEMSNAINNGKGWINYMGHGDFELWATGEFESSHVKALNNTGKLPIIISVACVNGEFKDRTCFAEEWQRLGSENESKGSIVFLGASVYQDWTSPQTSNQEMMHLLKKETYTTIGAVINNGQLKMLEQDNNQETFETWHIFGDPSLKMITDVPSELSVSHNESIGLGQQNYDVSVSGANDAKVCLYSKKQGIHVVRKGNRVSVPVNVTTNDTVFITVTARNKVPYQGFVIPGSTPISINNTNANMSVKMKIQKNQLNIFTTNNSISTVSIFNIAGKLINEYKISGVNKWHNLKMSKAAGMHVVSIKNENKTIMNKIINFTK